MPRSHSLTFLTTSHHSSLFVLHTLYSYLFLYFVFLSTLPLSLYISFLLFFQNHSSLYLFFWHFMSLFKLPYTVLLYLFLCHYRFFHFVSFIFLHRLCSIFTSFFVFALVSLFPVCNRISLLLTIRVWFSFSFADFYKFV